MLQDWMATRFIEMVEQVTGRKVRQFFSQVAHDADISFEYFLLEPTESPREAQVDPRET